MMRFLCAALLVTAASPAFAACGSAGMPPEMFKAFVTGTQEALNEHGFKAGIVDGKMGSRTQSAVRAYQRAAKLPVDGCVSQELLDHLNFAQPKVYAPGAKRP
ncbi:peptidoglycan-binding domain-containing protein [Azospirillum agricola]|uniref:peptidoglycan-binding domain-containing protein n=1 Tax=Azospirillum agricola TaxID=1720247 RepID=UPI000A0F00A8|nr:peptidoglycan-binding domain-containing protein [Azospirillum agricola]SMH54124.1 Putative peptidoglycan binding domain-containing protein' /ribosomal slippage [Azospirillum lipoferum]